MARELSDRTVAIRKALRETKGKLTFGQAVEQGLFPEALGVSQKVFNATKSNWAQGRKQKRAERAAARSDEKVEATAVGPTYTQTDFAAAIKFINKIGGRVALQDKMDEMSRHLAAFDSFVVLSKALAG